MTLTFLDLLLIVAAVVTAPFLVALALWLVVAVVFAIWAVTVYILDACRRRR